MAMDAAISAVERKFMELRQAERDAQDSAPIAASSRDNVRKFFDGDK